MSSPGRSFRKGVSLIELMEMFPNDEAATRWFEETTWPNGRCCGHCGSVRTSETPHGKPLPYWCPDCRSYFNVRTGTPLSHSKIPMRKWAIGLYLCLTSLKSVSSMKLRRDLGISQKAAWFMLHRIREAWADETSATFSGPVEADETYVGGKSKNKHRKDRVKFKGRGGGGKTQVVGIKDRKTKQVRARVVPSGVQAAHRVRFYSTVVPVCARFSIAGRHGLAEAKPAKADTGPAEAERPPERGELITHSERLLTAR